jgi:hypothetical protein
MSVDVEIYMNNIIKFFKNNPKDLQNLVPLHKEEEFFKKIREVAISNSENGKEISLTQKQLLEICVVVNGKEPKSQEILDERVFVPSPFGFICLN